MPSLPPKMTVRSFAEDLLIYHDKVLELTDRADIRRLAYEGAQAICSGRSNPGKPFLLAILRGDLQILLGSYLNKNRTRHEPYSDNEISNAISTLIVFGLFEEYRSFEEKTAAA